MKYISTHVVYTVCVLYAIIMIIIIVIIIILICHNSVTKYKYIYIIIYTRICVYYVLTHFGFASAFPGCKSRCSTRL